MPETHEVKLSPGDAVTYVFEDRTDEQRFVAERPTTLHIRRDATDPDRLARLSFDEGGVITGPIYAVELVSVRLSQPLARQMDSPTLTAKWRGLLGGRR